MKHSIESSIHINAKPEKVWQVLTDFENYSAWNPFILSIKGNVKSGNQIAVTFEEMNFKPKVLVYEPNKQFSWLGHLFIPGLFDGEHNFILTQNDDGSTTFMQKENFGGLLVRFFKGYLNSKTKPGFIQMNQKLKEEVENK
jgi:hypothetical protein